MPYHQNLKLNQLYRCLVFMYLMISGAGTLRLQTAISFFYLLLFFSSDLSSNRLSLGSVSVGNQLRGNIQLCIDLFTQQKL